MRTMPSPFPCCSWLNAASRRNPNSGNRTAQAAIRVAETTRREGRPRRRTSRPRWCASIPPSSRGTPASRGKKIRPSQRRALAAIVGPQRVLTTSELVADATYLEFESPDGTRFAQAKVIAVDYEANLALLGPASEKEGNTLFENTMPLEIDDSAEDRPDSSKSCKSRTTACRCSRRATLQSIDVTSNFLPGHGFLTYLVKASMQSAASSYSLPVLKDGKLAGVLISYNSKDQICDVASTDIVARFLQGQRRRRLQGLPQPRHFHRPHRGHLLPPVAQAHATTRADSTSRTSARAVPPRSAGVKKGDVLLAIDGQAIDRRGYNMCWNGL